ncbi:MAG: MATE family efflux transporter [Lachnospiraceae bacterium]|nr:MATE family efflux transporter [Lachnospiraceae bacterium]
MKKNQVAKQQHMFTNQDLKKLLIPLMIEQLLTSLMGTIDTIMVSNIGSAAISAVSLVDSINILVIQAFSALAAGGAIVCSQYIGHKDLKAAKNAANQLIFIITSLSVGITAICLLFKMPLLRLVFGKVEASVMEASGIYFFYTALSFPFIAVYNAGASVFRAQKNSRLPMTVSVISNGFNIAGNALLIWVFHLGVAGAAIATLSSRVFCAVVMIGMLKRPNEKMRVESFRKIRPDGRLIKKILAVGIPSGIENGMFQFGKLAIQSTVSTLGTTAIAAQAMANIMENLNGMASVGVGIGMMTVVGQCIGAGRKDEAIYFVKKLCLIGEVVLIISCLTVWIMVKPVTILGGMEAESARMCIRIVTAITIVKPLIWVGAFMPAYGMRAAGDAEYSMLISACTMWVFRVSLSMFLCRGLGLGLAGVWIGMFADWMVRGTLYGIRFHSRKWMKHRVI